MRRKERPQNDPNRIVGVTMGWDMLPTVCYEGGYVLPRSAERILNAQYYRYGSWPTDPKTGEKLPIAPHITSGTIHDERA